MNHGRSVTTHAVALVFLLICCVTLNACKLKVQEDFTQIVKGYNHSLKWKEYRRAAEYVVPERRAQFLQLIERYEADVLHIVDYDIIDKAIVGGGNYGRSLVRMEYYWERQGKTREITYTQRWRLIDKTWKVVPSLDSHIR